MFIQNGSLLTLQQYREVRPVQGGMVISCFSVKFCHSSSGTPRMTKNASFLFSPVISSLPIEGQSVLFPIGRIWCVGRNYAEHSREMGSDPEHNP